MSLKILKNKIGEFETELGGFSVGRCVLDEKKAILLETYDNQGKWSGYYWLRKDIISAVTYDTKYVKKIESYMDFWKSKNPLTPTISVGNFKDLNAATILDVAAQKRCVISLLREDAEDLETGFIRTSKNGFEMECINIETAEILGRFDIDVKKIIFFEIDSPDNWLLQFAQKKA